MEISAEPHPVTERRAAPRFPCNLETVCRMVATVPHVPWPAKVRNISLGGMCLVLSERVVPGTVIAVELHDGAADRGARTIQMRVTSAAEYPSGGWICGGAFMNKLSPEELRALLD